MSKDTTFRAAIGVAATKNYKTYQVDIKNAFVQGDLDEDVWDPHPHGYMQGMEGTACHLKKALDGLKQ